ncbi:dynamin family protein [Dietzia sp.]|uniref:dynamin family protein n=1 Tax=Dietzia sp. TaxID=1871616 RepID=UPI002FDB8046
MTGPDQNQTGENPNRTQPAAPPVNPPTGPLSDPVTAELDMALRELSKLGGDMLDHANRLGRILFSPPRVVIVGRLKAGKSTLVNALVGENIAATGALEVTNAVTVFHHGAPARAEVVDRTGRRHPVADSGSGVVTGLPVPLEDVAFVDRFLPSRAIADVTLIDTPGLATLTAENEEVAKRALLPGYDETRVASAEADGAVFVFESLPRANEWDFVARLGFTPLNIVGVLARSDAFGEGAMGERDAIEHAREYAGKLDSRMDGLVSTVIPVAGLLAEASRTGRVSEHVARQLARIDGLEREDVFEELESTDDGIFTALDRRMTLDSIGEYGTIHGARHAARGAAEMSRWLDSVSGVDELDAFLRGELLPFAAMQRALRITGELEQLAIHHPARDRVRHILGVLFRRPAMIKVALFRSYRGLVATMPQSPLTSMARTALAANSPAEAVGLPADAPQEHVDAAARDIFGRMQQMQFVGISAAEDDARANLGRYFYALGLGG